MGSTVVRSTEQVAPRTIINVTAQLTSGKKPEKTFEELLAGAQTPVTTASSVAKAAATATEAATVPTTEEANTEAGSLSLTTGSLPSSCLDSGNLAINISFFVRLSGEFEQAGSGVQSLFHRAARLVSDIFRQEQGWLGDPIGQFLNASAGASTKGPTESSSFFKQLLDGANSGLQQISQYLGAVRLPQLSGSSTQNSTGPTSTSWFNTNYGLDLAGLQLASARSASTNTPPRIPEYNKNGEKLYLISNDEAAQIRRQAKLNKLVNGSRDQSVRFLEAFNKFLDTYTADTKTTTAQEADSDSASDTSPTTEV